MAELQSDRPVKLVYLVEDDVSLAEYLTAHLEEQGYEVEVFAELGPLPDAVSRRRPTACIVDLIFPEGDLAGAQVMRAINQAQSIPIPAIFMSVRDDQEARLNAVRAGGSHYLVKPVNLPDLLRTLETLTLVADQDPYRVLVVEDDSTLAMLYQHYLEHSGMAVEVVTEPLRVFDAIEHFAPDLILMDIYMPECSGLELAAMLRQQHRFDGLPIVFLSSETDTGKQLAAMNLGGDDFLVKPVSDWQLVSALQPRIRRARELRRIQAQREATLRELEELKFALDQHAIVSAADTEGQIVYVNEKFCRVSGYSERELLGRNHNLLSSGLHGRDYYEKLWRTISNGQTWQGVVRNRRKDGSFFWLETTITPLLDASGKPWRYLAIRTEITGILEAEAAARVAREEAERANRAKSEFLASMSHELRTPLNTILGFTQVLEAEINPAPGSAAKESLELIQKSGWHLLGLIKQVLDLSKIEAGEVDLSLERLDLKSILSECLDFTQPLADARAVSLHYDVKSCAGIGVFADSARLKQALLNLLSNAVKYNVDQGKVEVFCQDKGNGWMRINVTDTGPGLTEAQVASLFQPFNRLGREGGSVEGTGIGLVITRRLVELMGGALGATTSPGQGSTFWLELQVAGSCEAMDMGDASHGAACVMGGCSVLFVEDNPASIKLVSMLLGRQPGIRILTAHSAELGFEIACLHKPDLIILDVDLENVDAIALCQRLKRQPELKQSRLIALSTSGLRIEVERIFAAGFDEHLLKPLQVDLFTETIQRLLDQRKLLK